MLIEIRPVGKIDWESPGVRRYAVPFTLDGTRDRERRPLYVAYAPKPGKAIVAIGGTRGDESEGPVGLKNVVAGLDPNRLVEGRENRCRC